MEESSKADEEIDVYALGEEKIATGNELLAKLETFKRIDGVAKIQRKISSEISSLQKVRDLQTAKVACNLLIRIVWFSSSLAGDCNEAIENQPYFVQ